MAIDPITELYYDPFDFGIDDDPYPVWKRMRAEAPLYYNEKHNFYALSRYVSGCRFRFLALRKQGVERRTMHTHRSLNSHDRLVCHASK